MTVQANKTKRLQELIDLQKAIEERQEPVEETSQVEATKNIPEEKTEPIDPDERPVSLRGCNLMELNLLYNDQQMDETERRWYERKQKPSPGICDPWYWMRI